MNMKKILSSALVVVMLFGAIIGLVPMEANAAHTSTVVGNSALSKAEIKQVVTDTYSYNFKDAAEMLDYERDMGYLDSVNSKGSKYTIYVNRYTGFMYYVNNVTGQVLTSNPYNTGLISSAATAKKLTSQITLSYLLDSGELRVPVVMNSSNEAAERAQISVSAIPNGLRVTYTLGDTATRFVVPAQITAEDYREFLVEPMVEVYASLLETYLREHYPTASFNFFEEETWGDRYTEEDGFVGDRAFKKYLEITYDYINKTYKGSTNPIRKELMAAYNALSAFATSYELCNPAIFDPEDSRDAEDLRKMIEKAPLTAEGRAVYVCSKTTAVDLKKLQTYLLNYASYSIELLNEHEATCLYVHEAAEQPVFRCALEYSFNDDYSLSVRLPANSISFDESTYNLEYIAPLQYFGAGDLREEGYVFIPDGSGAVVDYEDFYNVNGQKQNVLIELDVYGDDYAYSTPSGFHREQVAMPVYGISSTEPGNMLTQANSPKSQISSGFFAILEEGASLAAINVEFGGISHHLASAYPSYRPYPSDVYRLQSASGTASSSYTIVSDSKYTGSYVTRYVMLGDTDLALATGDTSYPATYVGMATYYRDYLKARGELKALTTVGEDLPLYIEALGSMSVIEKILTFPVSVSKALTTFEDVIVMYDELAKAKTKLLERSEHYEELAAAEKQNAVLKEKYLDRAAQYVELSNRVDNITNVNFKLTGFANGGMYFTYPTNVKWESVLGGKSGFETLLEATQDRTKAGASFAIYPEFDFLYMSNSAMFDGVSEGTDVSRMVDNRYASKQVYNSVLAMYESIYSMVISTDALDKLYSKFDEKYSELGLSNISVSTLGSDLNSNFDDDNSINRDDSQANVVALLDRIANVSKYNTMISKGNVYSIAYADHIIDIAIDSSHLSYSSYTVPFTGLVLHSYVSYAGGALNYTGSPDYDILRAIENGASAYYILCYQNTEFMKEDLELNKYYGVDYENWYDKVVDQYDVLNDAIGKYQKYEIVDHKVILAERVIDSKEAEANKQRLMDEFIALVEAQTIEAVENAFEAILAGGNVNKGVKVLIDVEALVAQAASELNIDESELLGTDAEEDEVTFADRLAQLALKYSTEYPDGLTEVVVDSIDYKSQYNYVTDSTAEDEDYVYTDYTVDNKRVVVVTYKDSETGHTVKFVLNYNVYAVTIKLDGASEPIELKKYGFIEITESAE